MEIDTTKSQISFLGLKQGIKKEVTNGNRLFYDRSNHSKDTSAI
jgi:ABC-type transport system involved in cytochrome c biogenesis ATPase subunit